MDQFIVSARKYRPVTFDSVVGQSSITSTLKNAIQNNHIAQAYLFCGPRGVGKTTCARIFAKTINCNNTSDQIEACDQCESCVAFNESRSYNIHELDAASNNSVDDIRNLTDQVRIPPQIGKYSVYIIDEVHMLSAQAFNAFLKTLEEPPPHAIFIMATTEKHKILPTILSRCQIFDFNRIKVEDTVSYLEKIANNEQVHYEKEALHIIAQKADGAMRDALSIFDQAVSFSNNELTYQMIIDNLNVLDYDYFFSLIDAFLAGDVSNTMLTFNEILEKGFDPHHFITGLSEHFRNLLMVRDPNTLKLLEVSDNIKEKYHQQAQKTQPAFLFKALALSNQCDMNYKTSNNKRLHVELSLMQLSQINEDLKKKADELNDPQKATKEEKKTANEKDPSFSSNEEKAKTADINTSPERQEQISTNKNEDKPSENKKKQAPSVGNKRDVYTFSLTDAWNSQSTEDTKEEGKEEKTEEQEGEKQESKDFTLDELREEWVNYAHQFKEKRPHFHNTMLSGELKMPAKWEVEFEVSNKVQADRIETTKRELTSFLKKSLHNDYINLKLVIDETKEKKRPYTDKEKYDHMKKKNQNLDILRQKFNLDFE